MNAEIFAALRQLEKERGIPVDYMVEKITQALVAAYKKDRDGYTDNVYVELTEDAMRMYAPEGGRRRGHHPPPLRSRSTPRARSTRTHSSAIS